MNKKPDPQLELASEIVAAMQPRLITFLIRQGVKDHEQQHDIIQDTVIKLGAYFRRRGDVRTSIQAVHLSRNLLSDLNSKLDPLVWRLLRTSKVDCFRREGRFPVLRG